MIPRDIRHILQKLAKGYPVIAITGPRQSGKTTLARHLFSHLPYLSLEDPDTRDYAIEDPRGFLAQYSNGAVFDEVQRSPELFSYLQAVVDDDPIPGRFVLTGSQQFGLMTGITQSLAGRVAMVQLLPFSITEIYPDLSARLTLNLDQTLFTGLYPPIHDRHLAPHIWHANYVQTYLERDVRQLINVRDLNSFQRFVRLCAGRTGQLVNLSAMASDAGITHNTAKAWLSILEASYIIFLLKPHFNHFNKRIIKTPKLYFYDTGLCSRLLAIQSSEQLNSHALRGAIFETFVVGEVMKCFFNEGITGPVYFWRDRSGNEIDLIIEKGDKLQPIEIKSGQTLNNDYFKGLRKWVSFAGPTGTDPVLIHGGETNATRTSIKIRPWFDVHKVISA